MDSDSSDHDDDRAAAALQRKQVTRSRDTAARRMLAASGNAPTRLRFIIEGMSCGGCASKVESSLAAAPGVAAASVDFATSSATVDVAPGGEDPGRLQAWVVEHVTKKMGYQCTSLAPTKSSPSSSSTVVVGTASSPTADNAAFDEENTVTQRALLRETEIAELTRATIVATICVVPFFLVMLSMFVGSNKSTSRNSTAVLHRFWNGMLGIGALRMRHLVGFLLSTPAVYVAGGPFFERAWRAWKNSTMTMDTLVALGVGVSYTASVLLSIILVFTSPTTTLTKQNKVTKTVFKTTVIQNSTPTYYDVATMLLFFVCLGKLLEARAKRMTGDALISLMQLVPKTATRIAGFNGDFTSPKSNLDETVPTSSIRVDDYVRVSPGQSVPCDGEVEHGASSVNEALVTGEAVPQEKQPGDAVIGGTVNVGERELIVRVTRCGRDTALAHILEVVRSAAASKPSMLRTTDYIASIFVPVVVVASLGVFVFWAVAGVAHAYDTQGQSSWLAFAFSHALATLVCACPCALGLAAPTCVVVACGVASKMGILLKSAEAIEQAASVSTVVFDKTGTLTTGEFVVGEFDVHRQFFSLGSDADDDPLKQQQQQQQLLPYIAAVESKSNHPIARAITNFCALTVDDDDSGSNNSVVAVEDWKQVSGRGISASLRVKPPGANEEEEDVVHVAVGSITFLSEGAEKCDNVNSKVKSFVEDLAGGAEGSAPTVLVCVAVNHRFLATIKLRDTVKPAAKATVAYLRHKLNADVWMVSGDSSAACIAVAHEVGIPLDCVHSGVLPEQKVEIVRQLQKKAKKQRRSDQDESTNSGGGVISAIYDVILQRNRNNDNSGKETVVAFIGDGINDAAALAQAHIGIAIGGGVDVAIDAADAVLLRDDIFLAATLFDLCSAAVDRIVLNILFASLYNVLMLPLSAGFFYPLLHTQVVKPQIASAAMMMSSISVVCSSLLLRLYEPPAKRDGFVAANNKKQKVAGGLNRGGRGAVWNDLENDDDDEGTTMMVPK